MEEIEKSPKKREGEDLSAEENPSKRFHEEEEVLEEGSGELVGFSLDTVGELTPEAVVKNNQYFDKELPQSLDSDIPNDINVLRESEQKENETSDEDTMYHKLVRMRALISGKEAGVVIGKGGQSVAKVRDQTGVRIMVTPHIPGVTERVLTMSGKLGPMAKAFAIIEQQLVEKRESEHSRDRDLKKGESELRLLIPASRMGFIIGKSGARVKEIKRESGCQIFSSEDCLPNSDERVMTFTGTPESLQNAVYTIGSLIGDHHETKEGAEMLHYDPANFRSNARESDSHQNNFPNPSQANAFSSLYPQLQMLSQQLPQFQNSLQQFGNTSQSQQSYGQNLQALSYDQNPTSNNPDANNPLTAILQASQPYYSQNLANSLSPQEALAMLQSQYQQLYNQNYSSTLQTNNSNLAVPQYNSDGTQTQEVFVPNNVVGAVIGRGGNRINEVRNVSGCEVKVSDPDGSKRDRRITIIGQPQGVRKAVEMINNSVAERQRQARRER